MPGQERIPETVGTAIKRYATRLKRLLGLPARSDLLRQSAQIRHNAIPLWYNPAHNPTISLFRNCEIVEFRFGEEERRDALSGHIPYPLDPVRGWRGARNGVAEHEANRPLAFWQPVSRVW
jgi:hypothetical protein